MDCGKELNGHDGQQRTLLLRYRKPSEQDERPLRATQELAHDAWGNTTVCEETVGNRFRFNGQQQDPIIKIDMWMTGSLESVNFDRQIPTRHPLNNDKMPFWILRTFSGRHGITLAGGILCIYFTDTENGTNSCGRMRKYGKNWEGLPLFII